MDPTKTDYEIVNRATPGPWMIIEFSNILSDCNGSRISTMDGGYGPNMASSEKDGAFIAHFNPAKVKQMLEEIDQLTARNAELEKNYSDARSELRSYDQLLDEKNSTITKLKECVEFYANIKNWKSVAYDKDREKEIGDRLEIKMIDHELDSKSGCYYAGKRAREFLKSMEK